MYIVYTYVLQHFLYAENKQKSSSEVFQVPRDISSPQAATMAQAIKAPTGSERPERVAKKKPFRPEPNMKITKIHLSCQVMLGLGFVGGTVSVASLRFKLDFVGWTSLLKKWER